MVGSLEHTQRMTGLQSVFLHIITVGTIWSKMQMACCSDAQCGAWGHCTSSCEQDAPWTRHRVTAPNTGPLPFWPLSRLADSTAPDPWARPSLLLVEGVVSRRQRSCQLIPFFKEETHSTLWMGMEISTCVGGTLESSLIFGEHFLGPLLPAVGCLGIECGQHSIQGTSATWQPPGRHQAAQKEVLGPLPLVSFQFRQFLGRGSSSKVTELSCNLCLVAFSPHLGHKS